MNRRYLAILACPSCQGQLHIVGPCSTPVVEQGTLRCRECESEYPIVDGIPRFVERANYTEGFSFQWHRHARTQHDQFSGVPISQERFFNETRWPHDLSGETILEVGCGSGRFTTHALSTGATVISVDMSRAVEVNYELHRDADNLLVVQADLRALPFRAATFDRLFCFGVLQHTPDVESAFKGLPDLLTSGGQMTVDVYDRREGWAAWLEMLYRTYYWVRPITTRMSPERLYRFVKRYVHLMWPITRRIARIPTLGRTINRMLLVHDYRQRFDLDEAQLREWAVLDTFDNLAPKYDQRQTISTIRRWFREAAMTDVDVHYGYNGIEGRGIKC